VAAKVTIVRGKGQITIPADIREAARLEEGDAVQVEMTADGILLRPRKSIDATQAWFWTPSWQAGERKATKDIEAGRVERYGSDREFLKSLE
jgi:AbrB family looped-hinge helix DNA binding protein